MPVGPNDAGCTQVTSRLLRTASQRVNLSHKKPSFLAFARRRKKRGRAAVMDLRQIKDERPEIGVIMITSNVLIDSTISALRGGAYDFIGKPINLEELRVTIRNGIEAHQLRREVNQVRKERTQQFAFEQIVGHSPAMQKMLSLAAKVPIIRKSSSKTRGPQSRAAGLAW
jgi:DNA-binding NtrC family response regulator